MLLRGSTTSLPLGIPVTTGNVDGNNRGYGNSGSNNIGNGNTVSHTQDSCPLDLLATSSGLG